MNSELYQKLTAPNGVTYNQPLGLFINNEWCRSKAEELISVVSPIDENEIVKVHAGGGEDIDDAVKAARVALQGPWSHLSGTERGEMMRKLADIVDAATNELATIDTFGSKAGAALAAHMDVDKIAFTGSTATGREVARLAASNLKETTIESGGKSPLLVFEDADLDQAVKWSHYGIMANQGQICTATSRILVHENVYQQFIELFKERVKSCKIGNPFESDTFQGPQVSKGQYERVLSFIESGKAEGATVALGGQPTAVNGKGFFIEPTIFTNASDNMKIYREEIFGPVAIISPFKTEDEAVRRANDTIYGLGAAVFTQDITRAHVIANKIEAGMVWINSSNDSDFRIPFGGVKQSGIGRELGEEGIRAYMSRRSVHVNVGNVL
ncbi:hypothetical protein LZL87_009000 [Fusarium oxysporum]|nr:hypothetical protein LZL87_009000 [Fusarium oxysporum]